MGIHQYLTILKRSKFTRSVIEISAVNAPSGSGPDSVKPTARSNRTALLRERDFRNFYLGYCTSMLGSGMSRIALTFAVLDSGGTATELGYVLAANVVPQVLFMIGGGVLADRLGRRPVMLITDASRFAVQGVLAASLFLGRPPLWEFVLLSAMLSVGEGFFGPALGGLRADIAPRALLTDANALIGVAQSAAAVLGPAIAGVLVGFTSPALVIAFDAASYGVSVVALASLRIPPAGVPVQSPWRDLTESWNVFKSETWLWIVTVQFSLFNLFTWAPYLLLGPILARAYLGGAQAWGVITAAFAGGSVLGGVFMVGRRRPSRPLLYAAICTLGYPVPCLMLAIHAPVYAVAGGALLAGLGGAIAGALGSTVQQQRISPGMLARISAIQLTGSYALGSAAWVVIGPIASLVGAIPLVAFGAGYAALSSAVVAALPSIRSVRWQPVSRPADAPDSGPAAEPAPG
jgi:Transmembrane secretion effector